MTLWSRSLHNFYITLIVGEKKRNWVFATNSDFQSTYIWNPMLQTLDILRYEFCQIRKSNFELEVVKKNIYDFNSNVKATSSNCPTSLQP